MKKKIKPICKNCRLFDEANKICRVVVLYEGERLNLPVNAQDRCFYENEFQAKNSKGDPENFKVEVEQVKFWVEDPKTGKKTDKNGIVKMEYPDGFFGESSKI